VINPNTFKPYSTCYSAQVIILRNVVINWIVFSIEFLALIDQLYRNSLVR